MFEISYIVTDEKGVIKFINKLKSLFKEIQYTNFLRKSASVSKKSSM